MSAEPKQSSEGLTQATISIVVPVYRGRDHLNELVSRLSQLRRAITEKTDALVLEEVILVDDGSIDGSTHLIASLAQQFEMVSPVFLSRNFGQHPATIAGILHSASDWIVTLDEDLQHPPERIPDLIRTAVAEKADVVYANPTQDPHSFLRGLASRGAKRTVSVLANEPNTPMFNSFRLIRGSVARASASVCDHETYYDIALSWFTRSVASHRLDLRDHRTLDGHGSGYRLGTLLSHARRLVVSSQTTALRSAALIGVAGMLAALAIGARSLWFYFADPSTAQTRGWTSLIMTVLLMGGLGHLLMAVLLEYQRGVVLHLQGKPTFFVVDRTSDDRLADFCQQWFSQ